MIPLWRQVQRTNITCVEVLADFLDLDVEQRKNLLIRQDFPLNLPMRLAEKIEKGKEILDDPILRQFVPLVEEAQQVSCFVSDPIGDVAAQKTSRLLQKYAGRALLICTRACAMHCRYCFRQHFAPSATDFAEELRVIGRDASISEVILSGGDPLALGDRQLQRLLSDLSAIPHVKRIRFHTRFPIGIPERIDEEFLGVLAEVPESKQIWFVIHCNHPRELDDNEVLAALRRVQKLGIPVLNQSVLLKGVNDTVSTLKELCEKLGDAGILPYYLHQLDRVAGASHFEVAEDKGRSLVEEIAKQLPGYAVPKYVREVAGEPAKQALGSGLTL